MAKAAKVEVWGFLMGEDVHVKTLSGSMETLIQEALAFSPVKDQVAIRQALKDGAWSEEPIWIGGHQIGFRVISVSDLPKIDQVEETQNDQVVPQQ